MRSVEFARNHGVTIHCRSSFSDEPGTIVRKADEKMEQAIISGVTHDTSEAKITLRQVPDHPGVAATVFGLLAESNVNVDMIIQNVSEKGMSDISFTTPKDDLARAKKAMQEVVAKLEAREYSLDESIAKISLVGAGMRTHPGIAAKMFRTLADAGVNIEMISTSPIRISCVVAAGQVDTAVRSLHEAFGLENTDIAVEASPACGEGAPR
jgi:aspartate kinase